MALPNDSHTAGVATTIFATHLAGGKEYPVGMSADADGHIRGSLPAFGLFIPPSAVGASKVWFDLHNGSSNVLRLRKAFVVVASDTAVTGAVSARLDWFRTSSVGTGGTAAALTASTSTTSPAVWAFDGVTAVPSGITARTSPTGGATNEQYFFPTYSFTEETNASTHFNQWSNVLPELSTEQAMELPAGKGLKVVQGTVASVGSIGFLVIFTVE